MKVIGQNKKNGRHSPAVLSLQQASLVCREFLPIREISLFYYIAALEAAGYGSIHTSL